MTPSFRSIEWSVRVYETLIKAYPVPFRREYGNEMILVFREQMTDTRRKRDALGLAGAWCRVLRDLAATVPEEHFHEIQRRIEMRRAALAILSFVSAAVLAGVVYLAVLYGLAVIAMLPLFPLALYIHHSVLKLIVFSGFSLSAFLSGLLFARVKPSFAPVAAVPLSTMAIWGLVALADSTSPGHARGWGELLACVGFVISGGLASVLGCVVAKKASGRLARLSVRWFQLVGPLAVLVCTSFVACVLRLLLLGDQVSADLHGALILCWLALLGVAAVTIADIVLLFVRSYKKAAAG